MGLFSSKIDNVVDMSMNEIKKEKIELKRISKHQYIHINNNNNISYSGKLKQKDHFTFLIINDRLQCIIPEGVIEYSDVNKISIALESIRKNENIDIGSEFSYRDYDTIKVVQKLSDKIKMTANRDNKINIFEHFTI